MTTKQTTLVEGNVVTPVSQTLHFKTQTKVPRVGVMLVGLGGNNGTTVAAGILANKHSLKWNTKASFGWYYFCSVFFFFWRLRLDAMFLH